MSVPESSQWPELCRRIQRGDHKAEEELAFLFRPRILAIANARLHNLDAAQDITQETLLGLLGALRDGAAREPDRLPAFVHGILRNLINKHFSQRQDAAEPSALPSDPPIADALTQGQERREMVRRALEGLKPVDQKILTLTLAEGLTPREIAPLVRFTPEQVRTHKSRAMRKVIEAVKKMTQKPFSSHR